jgi:hypothetical protein
MGDKACYHQQHYSFLLPQFYTSTLHFACLPKRFGVVRELRERGLLGPAGLGSWVLEISHGVRGVGQEATVFFVISHFFAFSVVDFCSRASCTSAATLHARRWGARDPLDAMAPW